MAEIIMDSMAQDNNHELIAAGIYFHMNIIKLRLYGNTKIERRLSKKYWGGIRNFASYRPDKKIRPCPYQQIS